MSEASEKSDRDLFSGSRIRPGAPGIRDESGIWYNGICLQLEELQIDLVLGHQQGGAFSSQNLAPELFRLICLLPGMVFLLSPADLIHSLRLSSNAPSPVAHRR